MLKDRIFQKRGATYSPGSISQKFLQACGPIVAFQKAWKRKRRNYARRKKQREEARRQRRIDYGKG